MKYHGWIYWVLCAVYYTIAIPLACIGDFTKTTIFFLLAPMLGMVLARNMEYRAYLKFIEANYPDEWGEFASSLLFKSFRRYGRFSYLILNEVENDPALLAGKKNTRDALFVMIAVIVIGIVSSIIVGKVL